MVLKSEVKYWLIEERVGLITTDELIQRVDKKILELDNPPTYLTDISLQDNSEVDVELNLNIAKIDADQVSRIVDQLLSLFNSKKISLTDLGAYSYRLSRLIDPNNDSNSILNWVDDEVCLVNQGVKEKIDSEQEIVKQLRQLAAL